MRGGTLSPCFSLFKTTKICFGSTEMDIFCREKAFHNWKKIRKNYFAPSEKFACYAPAQLVGCLFSIITTVLLIQDPYYIEELFQFTQTSDL